ncbi:MAG: hypothetical protein QNJ44_11235 [Rhodobacter sp.]|nr:hypothetical protein [Rhodobacter sp.]
MIAEWLQNVASRWWPALVALIALFSGLTAYIAGYVWSADNIVLKMLDSAAVFGLTLHISLFVFLAATLFRVGTIFFAAHDSQFHKRVEKQEGTKKPLRNSLWKDRVIFTGFIILGLSFLNLALGFFMPSKAITFALKSFAFAVSMIFLSSLYAAYKFHTFPKERYIYVYFRRFRRGIAELKLVELSLRMPLALPIAASIFLVVSAFAGSAKYWSDILDTSMCVITSDGIPIRSALLYSSSNGLMLFDASLGNAYFLPYENLKKMQTAVLGKC